MATTATDQFTQFLKITYDTEDNNWGNICNTNFEVLARAIAGFVEVNCTGSSDVNLSATEFSNQMIKLTGAIGADINVIVPTYERSFTVWNACTGDFTVTVKTAAGTGVDMMSNGISPIWPLMCDGVNVVIGMKILDGNTFGVYRNFQSTGINDEAEDNVITLTEAGRLLLADETIVTLSDGTLEWIRNSGTDIDHMHWVGATGLLYIIDGGSSKTTDETKLGGIVIDQLQVLNDGIINCEGAVTFGTTLVVTGAVTFEDDLAVAGNVTVDGDVTIGGDIAAANLGTAAFLDQEAFALAGHDHADASSSAPGFMPAADKAKLDALPATVGFSDQLLHLVDEKATGTDGGTFLNTAGGFGRAFTEAPTAEIDGASFVGDTITLPAGTYWIEATVPAYKVRRHKAKLYNETDATTIIVGTSEFSGSEAGDNASFVTRSHISGRFTLAAEKDVKIIHSCETSRSTDGRGVASSLGSMAEIYTDAKIWKIG